LELSPENNRLAGRVELLRGDVAERRLGLDEATHARLLSEVTHVVHAAGNVKLNRSLAEARRDAVMPLREIVTFCRGCRPFRELDYISTVGVAGRLRGLVPEAPLARPRVFRNTYEHAKADAEDELWAAIRAGLPATVHRPSMVVGDSHTGKIIHFQVFYHLCAYLSGART
jgi:thioester reductase-like protein